LSELHELKTVRQRSIVDPEGLKRSCARIRAMRITYVFAGLPVADFASSYNWYVSLFGRDADMFPHDEEAVWRLNDSAAVYVVRERERAGSSLATFALADLDTYEKRFRDAGMSLREEAAGQGPRRLIATDPDGNTLTFFQDPARTEA
jgi:catechol 2,3-dioxygenase-like lactoylglutathione lyase family enzyme